MSDQDRLGEELEQTEEVLSEQIHLNTRMEARAQRAEAEVARLRGEVDRLRELLGRLEWVDFDEAYGCPVCKRRELYGHTDDCELAAALRNDESRPAP